jgi:hypothetical protein
VRATSVIPYNGAPFFEELQDIYDEIGEFLPPATALSRPRNWATTATTSRPASGLFDVIEIEQYDWETVHDADGYIDLLNAFSGHIAMHDWQRDGLYGEIRRRLAQRPDGRLRRHWGGVLQVARRRADL